MFKSLRNRVLSWFMLFAMTIISIVFTLNYLYKKNESSVRNTVNELNTLHIWFLKDLKVTSDFISSDNTNTKFFIRRKLLS